MKVGQVLKVKKRIQLLKYSKKLSKQFFLPFFECSNNVKKIIFLIKQKMLFFKIDKNVFLSSKLNQDVIFFSKEYESDKIVLNSWAWPTQGELINVFSDAEGGNKGIDIAGKFNQPVFTTTTGKVVYVGNLLKGYGNLIIIRHPGNYLSAYAHNNKILVIEHQKVKIGDQIATMGHSGTNKTKLHFEIRHEGRSINPLLLLPKN